RDRAGRTAEGGGAGQQRPASARHHARFERQTRGRKRRLDTRALELLPALGQPADQDGGAGAGQFGDALAELATDVRVVHIRAELTAQVADALANGLAAASPADDSERLTAGPDLARAAEVGRRHLLKAVAELGVKATPAGDDGE